ncbi:MAG: hypothetical protein AAF957_18475 [Planctomycetota bacterium]
MRHALHSLLPFLLTALPASAQIVGNDFSGDYNVTSLGTPVGVPAPLGGINFDPNDPNTIWVGGAANQPGAEVYALPVTRGANGRITGFAGPGTSIFTAPRIDGGLAIDDDEVVFVTTFTDNRLLQYRPGSTSPDKEIELTPLGIAASTGTCNFVPSGFDGAGTFKILSFNGGGWYDIELLPDGMGTYDIGTVTPTVNTGGGPEGLVWVAAGNPGFPSDSVLVSEFILGRVSAYEVDMNGDAIESTRRDFISGLGGAEGAVIDPLTGDFLFSTFGGGNRILLVDGFAGTSVYCNGKTNSQGCVPTITTRGTPSISGPDDFELVATEVLNEANGLFVLGTAPDIVLYGGGTLCVGGTMQRCPVIFSGGTAGAPGADCTGVAAQPITQAFLAGQGWPAGVTIYAQFLSRDGGFGFGNNVSLSDGLRFTLVP